MLCGNTVSNIQQTKTFNNYYYGGFQLTFTGGGLNAYKYEKQINYPLTISKHEYIYNYFHVTVVYYTPYTDFYLKTYSL